MSEVTLDHDDGHTSIVELAQQAVQLHRDRFGSRPTSIVLTRAQYQRLSQEMAQKMSAPNPTVLMLASVPIKVVADREIVLVRSEDAEGLRYVGARLDAQGNVIVEGQDLGSGVAAFFGAGNTEYEWEVSVRAEDFPRLLQAIGAAPGTPVLKALAARFSGSAAHQLRTFLEERGLAGPGWTRIGE